MYKKIINLVIAVVVLNSLVNTIAKAQETNSNNYEVEVSNISMIDTKQEIMNLSVEDKLYMYLYNDKIDYMTIINNYMDGKRVRKIDYLQAVYMLLYNTDVSMSEYLEEFNKLLLISQNPSCISEDMWEKLFKNLINAYKDCLSISEMYLYLAAFSHELSCNNQEHPVNYDILIDSKYTCSDLSNQSAKLLKEIGGR